MRLERGVCGKGGGPECRESIRLRKEKPSFHHFSLREEGKVEHRGKQISRLGDEIMREFPSSIF